MSNAAWILLYAMMAAIVAAGPTVMVRCNRVAFGRRSYIFVFLICLYVWITTLFDGYARTGLTWPIVPYLFFFLLQVLASVWYFDRKDKQRSDQPATA